MANQWIIGLFGMGIGLIALAPATATPDSAPYNCLTREVWSPEKQAWCAQNSPQLNPAEISTESELIAAEGMLADQLNNTEWLLEDLNGTGVVDRIQTTLRFEEGDDSVQDGNARRINGSGGCNHYFSNMQFNDEGATATEQAVSVGLVGSTEMACPEAVMDQESRFVQALQTAERIELDGAYLYIYSEGQEQPMRFTQTNELVDPPMSAPDSMPEPVPMETTDPIPGLW